MLGNLWNFHSNRWFELSFPTISSPCDTKHDRPARISPTLQIGMLWCLGLQEGNLLASVIEVSGRIQTKVPGVRLRDLTGTDETGNLRINNFPFSNQDTFIAVSGEWWDSPPQWCILNGQHWIYESMQNLHQFSSQNFLPLLFFGANPSGSHKTLPRPAPRPQVLGKYHCLNTHSSKDLYQGSCLVMVKNCWWNFQSDLAIDFSLASKSENPWHFSCIFTKGYGTVPTSVVILGFCSWFNLAFRKSYGVEQFESMEFCRAFFKNGTVLGTDPEL